MRLVHDEQATLNNCPLLINFNIGGCKTLLCDCFCLADYFIGLLLNVGENLF